MLIYYYVTWNAALRSIGRVYAFISTPRVGRILQDGKKWRYRHLNNRFVRTELRSPRFYLEVSASAARQFAHSQQCTLIVLIDRSKPKRHCMSIAQKPGGCCPVSHTFSLDFDVWTATTSAFPRGSGSLRSTFPSQFCLSSFPTSVK
jgi:hypothetical protein